ncbi:MAG TPA: hypothetical protein VJI32_03910 [Candidatus Nanoarchaeia archaeon]|nr:hypothetical protein [Candidatus Nanoarchaeia archaeon]
MKLKKNVTLDTVVGFLGDAKKIRQEELSQGEKRNPEFRVSRQAFLDKYGGNLPQGSPEEVYLKALQERAYEDRDKLTEIYGTIIYGGLPWSATTGHTFEKLEKAGIIYIGELVNLTEMEAGRIMDPRAVRRVQQKLYQLDSRLHLGMKEVQFARPEPSLSLQDALDTPFDTLKLFSKTTIRLHYHYNNRYGLAYYKERTKYVGEIVAADPQWPPHQWLNGIGREGRLQIKASLKRLHPDLTYPMDITYVRPEQRGSAV